MDIKPDGYFVVTPRGKIALTVDDKDHHYRTSKKIIVVSMGPDGPYKEYMNSSLRYATKAEVRKSDLHGVGGKIGP